MQLQVTTTGAHLDAVNDLARAVEGITRVDVPELEVTTTTIEGQYGDVIDAEQDEQWWAAFRSIREIMRERVSEDVEHERRIHSDEDPANSFYTYDQLEAKTEHVSLLVRANVNGDVFIVAEYNRGSPWKTLYSGWLSTSPPDLIGLGRQVASEELTASIRETGSCAETLDYWQTHSVKGWYNQSAWAALRGVGRQTVSDRVRAARDALRPNSHEDTSPATHE